ncbi:hypothetical protein [Streptomyces hirsutus]
MHDEFLCHVTAYGVCDGRRIGVPLGTYRAPTLALALWVAARPRLLDRRAPRPAAGGRALTRAALVPVADGAPDVPAVLRAWCGDVAHQEEMAEALAAGQMVGLATGDDPTDCGFLAQSVDALRMQRAAPVLGVPVA